MLLSFYTLNQSLKTEMFSALEQNIYVMHHLPVEGCPGPGTGVPENLHLLPQEGQADGGQPSE